MKVPKAHLSCRISIALFEKLQEVEKNTGESRTRIMELALQAYLSPPKSPILQKETELFGALESLTEQVARVADALNCKSTNEHKQSTEMNTEKETSPSRQLVQLAELPSRSKGEVISPSLSNIPEPSKEPIESTPEVEEVEEEAIVDTPSAATEKGGVMGTLYIYKGKEAPIREHLLDALPQLSQAEIDRARSNINRAIRGRTDQKSKKRSPEEAIEREIERWSERLSE